MDRGAAAERGGLRRLADSPATLPLLARGRRRLLRAGRQCCFLRDVTVVVFGEHGDGVPRSSGEDAGVEFPAVAFEARDHAIGGKLLEREADGGTAAGDQAANGLVGQR